MTFLHGNFEQGVQLWFVQFSRFENKTTNILEHSSFRKVTVQLQG